MRYQGSCHCGSIAFEVDGDLAQVMDCNCTMCQRRGGLLWFVRAEQFRLTTDPDGIATYRFNKKRIAHHHCPDCGIATHSEGQGSDGAAMVVVNARCVEGVDLGTLKVVKVDGRQF